MSTIIHHFLPNVCIDTEELRKVASNLSSRETHPPLESYSTLELANSQTTATVAPEISDGDRRSIDPTSEDIDISHIFVLEQYSDQRDRSSLDQIGHTPPLEEDLSMPGQTTYSLFPPRTTSPGLLGSQKKLFPDATNCHRQLLPDHILVSRELIN